MLVLTMTLTSDSIARVARERPPIVYPEVHEPRRDGEGEHYQKRGAGGEDRGAVTTETVERNQYQVSPAKCVDGFACEVVADVVGKGVG